MNSETLKPWGSLSDVFRYLIGKGSRRVPWDCDKDANGFGPGITCVPGICKEFGQVRPMSSSAGDCQRRILLSKRTLRASQVRVGNTHLRLLLRLILIW